MTDHTHGSDHGHDVIVEDRGSGLGTILGIVLIVALLAGIWYFALGPGAGTFTGENGDVNVNVPEEVDVNVTAPEQNAP